MRVRRGDPDAEEPLRVALTLAADAELQHRWPSLCGLAELYWLQQRPQLAVDVLSEPYAAALDTDRMGHVARSATGCGARVESTARHPARRHPSRR